MIFPSSLKEISLNNIIHEICHSVPDESEMIGFIKICIRISYGYLRYKESRGYRIRESSHLSESRLEEMAVDAIAELFERNALGEYVQLRRYFLTYLKENRAEEDWIVLLRRLLISRTEQALFRIFRERDPEYAKILRGIKLAVSKNSQFKIIENLQGNFIVKHGSHFELGRRKAFTDPVETEMVMKYLFAFFRPADTIPSLLEKTFTALNTRFDDFQAIEIQEAVRILRTYRRVIQGSSKLEGMDGVFSVEKNLLQEDVKKRIQGIRKDLFQKIERDYLGKGKVDERMAQGIKNALSHMMNDMMVEGSICANLSYIQEFLPEMTKERYQREIRTKFEYLVKLLKTQVKEIVQ